MNALHRWWTRRPLLGVAAAAFLLTAAQVNLLSQQSPPAAPDSAPTQGRSGGGVYSIGGEVTEPVPVYKPDPEYSEVARRARYQGSVVLQIVVDATGQVTDVRVIRPLGLGLDEKAVETVRTWKFKPALRNGVPVPVHVMVVVSFRLSLPCTLPFAYAEMHGDDPNHLVWRQLPKDALLWWTQKDGSLDFPRVCITDPSLAKYAIVSRESSRPNALRTEVYQLAGGGKIQYPALFISKDATSAKRAFKDAVKYLSRQAARAQ
jgi:TonB family protein